MYLVKYPFRFNFFDLIASIFVVTLLFIIVESINNMYEPIVSLHENSISLHPGHLPEYAARTTLRMFIAVFFSLIFTFIYASIAAKTRLEVILIPLLDILQSVPILGYISFTVVGFLALFPGNVMGYEAASIFALFTSQAWNMAFSFYQSLKTIPTELKEVATILRMSRWHKFIRLELPFAIPSLLWNTMLSMSGGWFFIVASEAVSVGNHNFFLPGIGSYIATAIAQKSFISIFYALITMSIVIIAYNQLLFRPLVIWSKKFKYENSMDGDHNTSWVIILFHKVNLLGSLNNYLAKMGSALLRQSFIVTYKGQKILPSFSIKPHYSFILFYSALTLIIVGAIAKIIASFHVHYSFKEILHVFILGFYTALRVIILIVIATLFWIPLGVYIGLRPKFVSLFQPLIQFMAAFPVNLLFPCAVIIITKFKADPSIWLSPLMILGTQWYIAFNIIAGTAAFPNDLKEACKNYHIVGYKWWTKVMIPYLFPFIITGIITASGGAWNASIVSEIVSWGDVVISTQGLGSYIALATNEAHFSQVGLGIAIMCLYVTFFNKILWRPLYKWSEKNSKL